MWFSGSGRRRHSCTRPLSGGHGEGDPPLPFSNRVVKPLSADGTWWETARESRTPPELSSESHSARGGFLSFRGGFRGPPRGNWSSRQRQGLRGARTPAASPTPDQRQEPRLHEGAGRAYAVCRTASAVSRAPVAQPWFIDSESPQMWMGRPGAGVRAWDQ